MTRNEFGERVMHFGMYVDGGICWRWFHVRPFMHFWLIRYTGRSAIYYFDGQKLIAVDRSACPVLMSVGCVMRIGTGHRTCRSTAINFCTESEMVFSPYLLQPTLNHFPPASPALFETRYVQIQCNTGTYSRTFFPSAIWLWNTLPVDICQLSADSFKTHLNSFRFIWAPDYVLFLSSALHCFYPKLLCIVYCTAFSIHICFLTRGAILLGIESAPLSEDEDENVSSLPHPLKNQGHPKPRPAYCTYTT